MTQIRISTFTLFLTFYASFIYSASWIQTTDTDFNSGVRNNITIDGSGSNGSVNLSLATWYNSNWGYRKAITLANSTSTLVDFQVWIPTGSAANQVDISALVSAGKLQSDFDDIRFTDSDGVTLLNYWIRPSTVAPVGYPLGFWVKVSNIPENPTSKTIYIYYGNVSVAGVSSFDNTMQKLSTTTAFGNYDSRIAGLWNFDGNANDSSVNGNNGTITGATWTGSDGGLYDGISTETAKFTGNSLEFNGSGDFVDLGNNASLQITGSQTIEMWINPVDLALRRNPFGKAYGGEGALALETGGDISYYYGTTGLNSGTSGTTYQSSRVNSNLPQNNWYHITVCRDLQNMKIIWYVDGTKITEEVALFPSATVSSLSAYIGKGYLSDTYKGQIDEVGIYNVALSSGEVESHYQRRKYANPAPVISLVGAEVLYDPAAAAYFTSGNFISSSFDSGSAVGANWGNISWNPTNQPANTSLKFQIATNNDNTTWTFRGPDSSSITYYLSTDSQIWFGHDGDRYIKYKAYLSGDGTNIPSLNDITIIYAQFSTDVSNVILANKYGDIDAHFAKLIIPVNTIKRDVKWTITKKTNPSISISEPMQSIFSYDFKAEDSNTGQGIQVLDGVITLIMRCKSTLGTDGIYYIDNTDPKMPLSDASGKLALAYWDSMKWQIVGGNVTVEGNVATITTKVSHLTEYGIVVKSTAFLPELTVAPNPFTPLGSDSRFSQVNFTFSNDNNETVELKIYNIAAKLIRTINAVGTTTISWDGKDEDGDVVEGGVYLYQLKVAGKVIGKGPVVLAK